MRKIIMFLLISTLLVISFGCASDVSEDQSSELPNPIRQSQKRLKSVIICRYGCI